MRVLIADAYPIFRDDVADYVRKIGHEVAYKAAGGKEALNAFINMKNIDAVISGVEMANGHVVYLLQGLNRNDKPVPCLVHIKRDKFIYAEKEWTIEKLKQTFQKVTTHPKPDIWTPKNFGHIKDFLDSIQK